MSDQADVDAMCLQIWADVFKAHAQAPHPDLSPADLVARARRIANEAEQAVRARLADA